jgi:uncharacterized alpha-E superfamily protein
LEVHVLSRVAESLFWIGRYIERAENTARLLDVNYYATLEGSGLVSEQWGPLLTITGSEHNFREHNLRADGRSVPYWLAFSSDNPSSIKCCLEQARENARTLRDRLSTEMWESLNRAYHDLCFGTERILWRARCQPSVSWDRGGNTFARSGLGFLAGRSDARTWR